MKLKEKEAKIEKSLAEELIFIFTLRLPCGVSIAIILKCKVMFDVYNRFGPSGMLYACAREQKYRHYIFKYIFVFRFNFILHKNILEIEIKNLESLSGDFEEGKNKKTRTVTGKKLCSGATFRDDAFLTRCL